MGHQKREDEGRRGRGADTGASRGDGDGVDVRGALSCALAGAAIVAEVVAYLVWVKYGIFATVLCLPLFVASIVLSGLSLRRDGGSRLGGVGRSLGVVGLACSWAFLHFVMFAAIIAAFDPSRIDTLGPLALLNWDGLR